MASLRFIAGIVRTAAFCSAPLLLSGCEKELDFHYHDISPQLVVEATVSESGASVALTCTTPMDEVMNMTHLTDAAVSVTDITTGISRQLSADKSGIYADPTPGLPGHTYRLEILRNGCRYVSECEMPQPADITEMEFQWVKMPYDDVAALQLKISDCGGADGDRYWVRVYRNGEPYLWQVVNDDSSSDGVVTMAVRTSRRHIEKESEDEVLVNGDVVTATVAPVSQAMADYLDALSADSNGPQMFDGDFCLGYFMAAPVTSRSVVYDMLD